jgi:tRNA-2-methylthio-N6-dimethylallyladenosine synthase
MAERLKEQLLEKDKCVDLVVGPDAYRDLPRLLAQVLQHIQIKLVFSSQLQFFLNLKRI